MQKSFSVSVIAGLALAFASTGALAQAKKKPASSPPPPPVSTSSSSGGIGAGDTEFSFFGNIHDEGPVTSFTVGVGFGNYISDKLELRLNQSLTYADAMGASSFAYIPYGSAEYQIITPGSPFVPYIGGGVGMFMLTTDDFFFYNLFLTPTAGVKYFLNERTSVEYALSYQFPLIGEACGDIDCVDADITTLQNALRFNIYY
jgi:hypothetical protein